MSLWIAMFGWSLVATTVLTTLMTLAQGLGWSRISLPYLLGTMLTPRRSRAMLLGFAVHFLLGLVFAAAYVPLLRALGGPPFAMGTAIGLCHGVVSLSVGMELLAVVHPRMADRHHGPTPNRHLEPPGFLALHYGRGTPMVTLFAHAAYGAILGAGYPG